jgi:hypothetical protein
MDLSPFYGSLLCSQRMRCAAPEAFRIALLDIFMSLRNQNITREQACADSRNRLEPSRF